MTDMVLIRFALLLLALVMATFVIVTHGVRGILVVIAVALVVSVPRTRGWKWGEAALVRITGSRRRAAFLAMVLVIGAMTLLAVLQFVH